MSVSNWSGKKEDPEAIALYADRLSLYDRYGSVAYGVILQIIPQPELAQTVLVDLFASPQLLSLQQQSTTNLVTAIVRLARAKALERKPASDVPVSPAGVVVTNHNASEVVFNLSFRQGFQTEVIAERLQMSCSAVMTAIRDYFAYLRTT